MASLVDKHPSAAVVCAAIFIAGCQASQPADLGAALNACSRGAAHVEVQITGRVDRYLGIRHSRSGSHEGFLLAPQSRGSAMPADVTVEDNIDLTGFIPLRSGEHVQLQGQYECNDGVVHWTHHDPSGRHIAGYVEVNGHWYR